MLKEEKGIVSWLKTESKLIKVVVLMRDAIVVCELTTEATIPPFPMIVVVEPM